MSQVYHERSRSEKAADYWRYARGIYRDFPRLAKVSFWVILTMTFLAFFGPEISPFDPYAQDYNRLLQPPGSFPHILGTDAFGRDVLTRMIVGARISLIVATASIAGAVTIGMMGGSFAAWKGGYTDESIMRVFDVVFSFPSLVLALALVATLGPSMQTLILAFAVVYSPQYARLIRSTILSVKEEPYVDAAVATGLGEYRVLAKHVIPNAVAPIIVQGSFHLAWVMLKEAALSFLGLGVRPPTASWGIIIANGRTYMPEAWWLMTFPGLAIMAVVLSFNFIGDALRDEFDPYEETSQG